MSPASTSDSREDLLLVPRLHRVDEPRVGLLDEPRQPSDPLRLLAELRLERRLGARQLGEGEREQAVDQEAPLGSPAGNSGSRASDGISVRCAL